QSFNDNMVLKFTADGKFLMQIGKPLSSKGSNDVENLRLPAKTFLDRQTNELYVADGYGNHRVIVFDADTGKYKRHWGAYGKKPDDSYFAAPARAPRGEGGRGAAGAASGGGRGAAGAAAGGGGRGAAPQGGVENENAAGAGAHPYV